MRLLLVLAWTFTLSVSAIPVLGSIAPAQAAECTGANCPPPTNQGHDCERERQEQTTS